MGQKVNPHGLRVGVIKNWDSRWYAPDEKFGDILVQDPDTAFNGLQSFPVIFPVNGLAQHFVKELAHQKHIVHFPLGNKRQPTLGEGPQQHSRVNFVQVVAHQ